MSRFITDTFYDNGGMIYRVLEETTGVYMFLHAQLKGKLVKVVADIKSTEEDAGRILPIVQEYIESNLSFEFGSLDVKSFELQSYTFTGSYTPLICKSCGEEEELELYGDGLCMLCYDDELNPQQFHLFG